MTVSPQSVEDLIRGGTCAIVAGGELVARGFLVSRKGFLATAGRASELAREWGRLQVAFNPQDWMEAEALSFDSDGPATDFTFLKIPMDQLSKQPAFHTLLTREKLEELGIARHREQSERLESYDVHGNTVVGRVVFGPNDQWFYRPEPEFERSFIIDGTPIVKLGTKLAVGVVTNALKSSSFGLSMRLLRDAAEIAVPKIEAAIDLQRPFETLNRLWTAAQPIHILGDIGPIHAPQTAGSKLETTPGIADDVPLDQVFPPRFPSGGFFYVPIDESKPIQRIANDLSIAPAPTENRLEFRFWLSPEREGMAWKSLPEPPELVPPQDAGDVVQLQIDVWSDDLDFQAHEETTTLELLKQGATKFARFDCEIPLKTLPSGKAEFFVFVRHQQKNQLLAVIGGVVRVSSKQPRRFDPPDYEQQLSACYLAAGWFRVSGRPLSNPALTIYVRNNGKFPELFVFRDRQSGCAWHSVGVANSQFYDLTKSIYLHLTKLAIAASEKQVLRFDEIGADLAVLGDRLSANLFYARANSGHAREFGDWIQSLPEGSELSIAMDDAASDFIIPWGLVYDSRPPDPPWKKARKLGFWGYRFKLAVVPHMPDRVAEAAISLPPRVGKVYENHAMADDMAKFLEDLKVQGRIAGTHELTFQNSSLPELNSESFSLLHFFCHGYTEINHHQLIAELPQITQQSKLMGAPIAKGSHISTQKGTATLSQLQKQVIKLSGSPIVLLSMCESAQVSSSGQSFVTFFLQRGASAVVGTEAPNLFQLANEVDKKVIARLLNGDSLRDAVYEVRREFMKGNVLALIYCVYGNASATLGQQNVLGAKYVSRDGS